MKTIGNALSFYAKYPSEMVAIYEEEQYELLKNNDQDQEKVEAVGDAACEEVKRFLLKITSIIRESLEKNACVKPFSKQATMRDQWKTELHVWEKRVNERPKTEAHTTGLSVRLHKEKLRLVIWAWSEKQELSNQKVVEKIRKELSFANTQEEYDWDEPNTVVIDDIIMEPVLQEENFFVDEDVLIKRVSKTFQVFSEKYLKEFLNNTL